MVNAADLSASLFLAATALHAGFQVTVTVLVYPVLVEVPAGDWSASHDRHSRRILPLVVLAYGALVLASVPFVMHHHGPAAWAGLLGAWGAMLLTAVAAAPTHGRLTTPDPSLLRRLLAVDRLRAVLACVGLAGAVLVVLGG